MKDIFRQLDRIEKIKKRIFNLWLENKTLQISPKFFNVSKEIGKEFYNKYKKVAKIKVVNE